MLPSPDQTGAGVRYEGAVSRSFHVHLHGNENGLFGTNADPFGARHRSEDCEIDHNGVEPTAPGSINSHNIYIAGDIGMFYADWDSYVHDANIGHEVKSRAENTIIEGNRIFDNCGHVVVLDRPASGRQHYYCGQRHRART